MGLDQLLELLSNVSEKALPIIGFIVFIFVILFLYHLTKLVKSLKKDCDSLQDTLEKTNLALDTVQKPLKTLSEVSETIDLVHDASKNAVQSSIAIILSNLTAISEWISSFFTKKDKKKQDDSSLDISNEDVEEPLHE